MWPNLNSVSKTKHFNEGLACDAVLRLVEHQRRVKRQKLRFPEREGHEFPVDLVCEMGGIVIALEHTGTEPFEGHVKLQAEAQRRVQPLVDAVAPRLPPDEDFYLDVPLAEWSRLTGKEFDRVCRALSEWIVQAALTVPIAETGRRIPSPGVVVPGVPFPVRLNRTARYEGLKVPFHLVFQAGDVEAQRLDRMRRTLKDKCPKLAGWKTDTDAHTVLVLEWSDFQVTNPHLVATALSTAEAEISNRADVVYLVAPFDEKWCVYTLRAGNKTWLDQEPADRTWEVPMGILEDITRSPAS